MKRVIRAPHRECDDTCGTACLSGSDPMTTLRQLLANRRNAQLSTGPRTPEGLDAASMNALNHGMTASKVWDEDEEQLIQERLRDWEETLQPEGAYQRWLAERAVAASVRLDHC